MTLTELTKGPTEDMLAVWTPDSERVYFASDRAGTFDIYSQAADGASEARLEFAGSLFEAPQAFTPDGAVLLVYEEFRDTRLLALASPDRLEPLLVSEFDDRLAQVSRDGHWIAYESNESGDRFEVFVRPFPEVNRRRRQVSIDGGRYPLWGPNDELFYVTHEGDMMAVPVTFSPDLTLGQPRRLFQGQPPPAHRSGRPYDVAPDGRFLVTRPVPDDRSEPPRVSVVLNFFDELVQRAPSRADKAIKRRPVLPGR
jgi:hypothetical protein